MPTKFKQLTPLEDLYLENTTTRNAFYQLGIFEVGSQFEVAATWGSIGTNGQTKGISKHKSLALARNRVTTLRNLREKRGYVEAKKRGKAKKTTTKTKGPVITKSASLSRFSMILD